MYDVILSVVNKHIKESGDSPVIIPQPGELTAYFQNEHGEQNILVYNRATNICQIWMGDVGWDSPLIVNETNGIVTVRHQNYDGIEIMGSVILSPEESAVVSAIYRGWRQVR